MVLTGAPTFTGYLRIVDLAHQFDFTQQLIQDGRSLQEPIDSSFEQVVAKLVDSGYPGGFHSVLGGLARMVDTDIAWVYQPLLAVAAAMGALALYGLLDGIVDRPPLRALAAFIAAQPNLLYGYGLAGGFKELITAGLLVLVVALLRANRFDVPTWRSALPIAVVAAAGFAVISYTFLPWLGLILGCAFLLAASRRPAWPLFAARWAWLAGLTALLCLPTLDAARKASGLTGVVEGQGDLGNLAAPLKPWTSAGVWLTGDYRYPLTQRVDLTYVLVGFVLVLAAVGVAYAVRRRQAVPIVLALAFGGALAYVTRRTGPWVDAKAFAITGMVCIALAFVGAAALRRGPLRLLAWPAAAVVAAAVLFGNALAYHEITLAPRDQLRDLERLGTQLKGRGPTLYPAFNEYAEYFLRRQRATSLVNPANFRLEVRPEAAAGRSGIQFAWDLDDFVPSFVQSFEYIVERGHPVAGRPPSNYVLVERTQYHRVWRKDLRAPEGPAPFPLLRQTRRARPPQLPPDRRFRARRGTRSQDRLQAHAHDRAVRACARAGPAQGMGGGLPGRLADAAGPRPDERPDACGSEWPLSRVAGRLVRTAGRRLPRRPLHRLDRLPRELPRSVRVSGRARRDAGQAQRGDRPGQGQPASGERKRRPAVDRTPHPRAGVRRDGIASTTPPQSARWPCAAGRHRLTGSRWSDREVSDF